MRFRGIHRKPRDTRWREFGRAVPDGNRDTGRDPGGADAGRAADGSADGAARRDGPRTPRPRGSQPRDRFGRFRKAGRDDDLRAAPDARSADAPAEPARPRFGRRDAPPRPRRAEWWRDYELDHALPRAEPHPPGLPHAADGRRHCGVLEQVLHRQWDARLGPPPAEVIRAVDSLAALPDGLKEVLAGGLDGIYVGAGGVPRLDDMGHLAGRPLPSGRATWDICAGAYGDGKIVVGDRPSPTPDVMLHEVGHALDDIDGEPGTWQSDGPAFRALYELCRPHLASDFHLQGDALGRREFFADAFAAISSRQRPALVDMLAGNIRVALEVMLFFNRRYGI
ncbi:hypothetical protein BTM25_41790 [Actinomadura rubteroloni]|uniref:Uncharacterized protein n=1 Tax=Actinomadura rubteroloni TaxID=1926885 RepID=A0A2P4UKE9_9ACTN|nr:hypothetical protein [Actinomadura rubteroloni]POM25531.1 hypothetical protein BTM25_41790 [Actinomadura rubteroloni]